MNHSQSVVDHRMACNKQLWRQDNAGHPGIPQVVGTEGIVTNGTIWYYCLVSDLGPLDRWKISIERTAGLGDGTITFYDLNIKKDADLSQDVNGWDSDDMWSLTLEGHHFAWIKFTAEAATTVQVRIQNSDSLYSVAYDDDGILP